MKLSPLETTMLSRLRKRDAFLRRWRWPMMIFHISLVIAWFCMLLTIVNFPNDPIDIYLLIASHFLPVTFIGIAFHAGWIGYLIANWNGNAKTVLLLKLIDEHQTQQDASPSRRDVGE